MKILLSLLYLMTGLLFAWGLWGGYIAAHMAQGAPPIPPTFWVAACGAVGLLVACVLTPFRLGAGAALGLAGCLLLLFYWGGPLLEQARSAATGGVVAPDAALYALSLVGAVVASCVALVAGAKKGEQAAGPP